MDWYCFLIKYKIRQRQQLIQTAKTYQTIKPTQHFNILFKLIKVELLYCKYILSKYLFTATPSINENQCTQKLKLCLQNVQMTRIVMQTLIKQLFEKYPFKKGRYHDSPISKFARKGTLQKLMIISALSKPNIWQMAR